MSYRNRSNRKIGVNEIQEGMEAFNQDDSNLINPFEIKESMEVLGLNEKKPNLYALIETLCSRKDVKRNGGLTVDKFVEFLEEQMNDTETIDGLSRLFDVFRDPRSVTVPMTKFPQTAKDVEDEKTADELKELIDN